MKKPNMDALERVGKLIAEKVEEHLAPDPFSKGIDRAVERVCEEIMYDVLSKDEASKAALRKECEKWIADVIAKERGFRPSKRSPDG